MQFKEENRVISAGDFRNGITIELDNNIFQIIEFQHVKPGKGAAFVRTKLKNIILAILAATNLCLLLLVGGQAIQGGRMEAQARESAIQFLRNQGVEVDESIIPQRMELEPQAVERDMEGEERVAQSPKYQKVQEVAEYLQANPGTRESLDQLAGRFYISRSWLSRIFREVTGFSVSEYANMVRVKRAQKLLAHGDYSVTEISELVGFESITYFERIFRRYTDRTPLGYRREKRGDIARGRE